MNDLFSPLTLGQLQLNNRIIMAPMTRSRALPDGTPSDLMQQYYQQRATAGLIISEGVYPSEDGKGYCRTPGIITTSHIAAWKNITTAVHNEGGKIVMQLMHCGRIAHKNNKSPESKTVAPSAIRAKGKMFTEQGMCDFDEPIALTTQDIQHTIQQHQQATEKAFEAGFDGIELHCTSGYLPAQFLSSGSNTRNDEYGGTVENRCRFIVETLQAISNVNGANRIGIRICPGNPFNDLFDADPQATFEHLLAAIQPLHLAYLHAIKSPNNEIDVINLSHSFFKGSLIMNDGFTAESANTLIQQGKADAVSFGRAFIANPDLVNRFYHKLPLADIQMQYLYTADKKGYCDYPAFA